MALTLFDLATAVSLVVLILLAVWIGRRAGLGWLGILIDGRGRYSLTHFQIVLWTIVILSSLLGVLVVSKFDMCAVKIPGELLGLMGISAGSGVLAGAVKGTKDAPGAQARVARAGAFALANGNQVNIVPRFAQIWLEEEGDQADKVINITKYQNFIFTLVILGVYVTALIKAQSFPKLPDYLVGLIGISHAGYIGGKMPNKT